MDGASGCMCTHTQTCHAITMHDSGEDVYIYMCSLEVFSKLLKNMFSKR